MASQAYNELVKWQWKRFSAWWCLLALVPLLLPFVGQHWSEKSWNCIAQAAFAIPVIWKISRLRDQKAIGTARTIAATFTLFFISGVGSDMAWGERNHPIVSQFMLSFAGVFSVLGYWFFLPIESKSPTKPMPFDLGQDSVSVKINDAGK